MKAPRNPWFDISMDMARLGLESQSVIGLRMAKAAWGGPAARKEAELMISEKTQAAIEAQGLFATSLMSGKGHLAP
ncbi:MAG: hypothetical protein ABI376_01880, partial [Caulobacteraceae bacterium]